MRSSRHAGGRLIVVLGLAVATLAFVGAASADKPRIRFTAAGQAAARAAVLKKADFGGVAGWRGGRTKPDLSSTLECSSYHPKQSDLVVIGVAESDWSHSSGLSLGSEAWVLRTAKMVKRDWRRSVLSAKVLPCLRESLAKELGAKARLVSARRLVFPRFGSYATALFRFVIETESFGTTFRFMTDAVLIAARRTEITLTSFAPLSAKADVRKAEVRLARILLSRVRA